ncbi:MAG TPA: HlyD family secretion protein [Bradyrhizobium sp.]
MDGSPNLDAASRVDTISVPVRRRRWSRRQLLLTAAAGLLVVAVALWAGHWWETSLYLVSTDDAYVDAHSALIAPKITGYIANVAVDDNETVRAGQVLASIDPRDYQAALDEARANVAATEAAIDSLSQQIEEQKLVAEQDRQLVASDQAALVYSQQNFQRYSTLAHSGAGSVQQAQQATADIREKEAGLQHDSTAVTVAEKQIGVFEAQVAQAKANLEEQQAAERQATLNLDYTVLRAPVDGTIGARTATVGQYVQPGTQLMALVPLRDIYITANFKETQLTDVRPAQPVTISVDTFPGVMVRGHVASIAPASGEQFALLPPDNATGNFTKIVQRIPVKILVDPNDPLAGMLRPGMSVEPTIDTESAPVQKPGSVS